jgi:hypothetical protein
MHGACCILTDMMHLSACIVNIYYLDLGLENNHSALF